MFGPLVDVLRQVQKQRLFQICRHAHANNLKQENQKKVHLSGNFIGYSSVTFYFEATWNELLLNTRTYTPHTQRQPDVQQHLPAVNSNCINIKSQRPSCQGQTKSDEINVSCCCS